MNRMPRSCFPINPFMILLGLTARSSAIACDDSSYPVSTSRAPPVRGFKCLIPVRSRYDWMLRLTPIFGSHIPDDDEMGTKPCDFEFSPRERNPFGLSTPALQMTGSSFLYFKQATRKVIILRIAHGSAVSWKNHAPSHVHFAGKTFDQADLSPVGQRLSNKLPRKQSRGEYVLHKLELRFNETHVA